MPETPHDDEFGDLFRRLPTAGGTPAPTTRREARAAASASGAPSASGAAHQGVDEPARPRADQPIEALFADPRGDAARREHDRHRSDRRKSRIAKWVVFALILAIFGGLVAGGFYVWNTYEDKIRAFMGWEEPKDYADGMQGDPVSVTIVKGDTGASISQTLFDAGVTKTPQAFYDYLISTAQEPTFQPGVYSLHTQMTSEAALAALEDPANKLQNTAQLREGLTVDQSLSILSDGLGMPLADLQAAVADPAAYGVSVDPAIAAAGGQPLEGWLFPATYTFDPGVTATQVIKTLVDRTVSSLDAAGVPVDQRARILTVASIIQREARSQDDFYKVSRVIENRLVATNNETHGYLQMDSTAQFGYGELHDGTASSSQEALDSDNPWNTYKHPGLPIGPISNPGDVAIDAAMHPADGPWLYFVTVNLDTGETVFSTTYAEHQAAVKQWQDWCAANPGSGC